MHACERWFQTCKYRTAVVVTCFRFSKGSVWLVEFLRLTCRRRVVWDGMVRRVRRRRRTGRGYTLG